MEHFVSVVRREYVESYESRIPPSVTQTQLKKAISSRGNNKAAIQGRALLYARRAHFFLCLIEFDLDDETFRALWNEFQTEDGIGYDEYMAVLAKLQVLRGQLICRTLAPNQAGPSVRSCQTLAATRLVVFDIFTVIVVALQALSSFESIYTSTSEYCPSVSARFQTHLQNLPCDCQVATFSFKQVTFKKKANFTENKKVHCYVFSFQFMKSAIF